MKKTTLLLLTSLLLFGCTETKTESKPAESEDTTEESIVVMVDEDTSATYDTVEQFKGSTFYSNIKSEGRTPYLLEYDEEKYTFQKINSDLGFYKYVLLDNTNQKHVSYTITYDTPLKSMAELSSMYSDSINETTQATNSDGTFDVFVSTSKYNKQENYILSYLPYDGCEVTLVVGNNSSKEDILSYFDDFALIADNS